MSTIKEKIFVEKYRPKLINNVICENKNKIIQSIKTNNIPHFLFHSLSPGTGKTSLAKAIINELKCDYISFNSSDERQLDIIREQVKIFASGQSRDANLKRCVFMDEFDGMLKPSQNALRNIMESFSTNCFFILTCNNINKVIEPIQSRCMTVQFNTPDKNQINLYLKNICISEKINYRIEGLDNLINKFYPDIRQMVSTIQEFCLERKEIIKDTEFTSQYEKYMGLIIRGQFLPIKDAVYSGEINCREFNNFIFDNIWKNQTIQKTKIKQIVFLLADSEIAFSYGTNEKIIFIANLLKILNIVKE